MLGNSKNIETKCRKTFVKVVQTISKYVPCLNRLSRMLVIKFISFSLFVGFQRILATISILEILSVQGRN